MQVKHNARKGFRICFRGRINRICQQSVSGMIFFLLELGWMVIGIR